MISMAVYGCDIRSSAMSIFSTWLVRFWIYLHLFFVGELLITPIYTLNNVKWAAKPMRTILQTCLWLYDILICDKHKDKGSHTHRLIATGGMTPDNGGDIVSTVLGWLNTLRPRQNGRRFTDDTFKRIFLNENIIMSIKISLKFVPMVRINNTPALVQIMAWRRPGDKPLSGPMMVYLTDAYMRHSFSMS